VSETLTLPKIPQNKIDRLLEAGAETSIFKFPSSEIIQKVEFSLMTPGFAMLFISSFHQSLHFVTLCAFALWKP
jgi:hypothetical protein